MAVTYPKFKNGEATVRNVKVNPNFGEQILMMYILVTLAHQP